MPKRGKVYDFRSTRDLLMRRSQCYYAIARHLNSLKRYAEARKYDTKGFKDYKLAEHIEKTNSGKGKRIMYTMKAGA